MSSLQPIFEYVFDNFGSIVLFGLFVSLVRNILYNIRLKRQLPSGPTGLPIVGYLPFLGKDPHKDIAKLSEKYGNIFTLQLGVKNVVILNDWEAVKDAFHKDAFLGRPKNTPFSVVGQTVSFSDESGPVWREHRRFSLQVLRDLGFGKGSMEDRIIDEISYLTERIDKSNEQPIDIHAMLSPSMSNNICHLVFGHRFDTDDPVRTQLDRAIDQSSRTFSQIGVLAMAPLWFAKTIIMIGTHGNRKTFQHVKNLMKTEITSHQKKFNNKNQMDYIDGYLAEMEIRHKKDPNTSFTLDKLEANCRAFFGAGSETVKTSTEWCILLAAHYLNHQKRIHKEIDEVFGKERPPAWSDRLRMPFTQAFINEVYRWKTIIPFNLLRRAVEDSSILGHFIPKDTIVLANLWAVHNDPKTWDNPQEFNPNRFLSDDGKELIKTDALIPFSVGKRACVGETLGRTEVFLYFTSLLQRYTISPSDGEVLNLTEDKFGLSLQPKETSLLQFKRRL